VDGVVLVQQVLTVGRMARLRVTGAMEYDLMAAPVGAAAAATGNGHSDDHGDEWTSGHGCSTY